MLHTKMEIWNIFQNSRSQNAETAKVYVESTKYVLQSQNCSQSTEEEIERESEQANAVHALFRLESLNI